MKEKASFWMAVLLACIALLGAVNWIVVAVYLFVIDSPDEAWRGLMMAYMTQ